MSALQYIQSVGARSAHEIAWALQVPVESVYAELVPLESAGAVKVRVTYCGKIVTGREWVPIKSYAEAE